MALVGGFFYIICFIIIVYVLLSGTFGAADL